MENNKLNSNETPILIVDDSLQYSQVLQKILKVAFGYQQVTTVASVEEAEKVLADNPDYFKLFFVDYNLPNGRTGTEFLEQLKDQNELNQSVAFLITADPSVENQKEALRYGALGVVAKPFDRKELEKQLDKAKRSLECREEDSF
jgi:DNA-binding NtrC family response regulator